MSTDAFHPDLGRIARFLPRGVTRGPTSLRAMRALMGVQTRLATSKVPVATVGSGSVSVRLHRPVGGSGPHPALLWVHGGGYVIGSAAQDDRMCRYFANRLGILVAAVEYRLAPEQPFPVPLEDCHRALVWLARESEVDPHRVAVGGGSAGGGLAAALALLARERGEVPLAFQLLVYPMVDDRTALRRDIDEHNFRLWDNRCNAFGWQSYTGHRPGSPEIAGLAAPARYDDLSGLPPAWLGVGTLDLFHDEDVAYADRLNAAGVGCTLEVVPGAFHGFDRVHPTAPVSRAFHASMAAALSAALRPAGEHPD